MSKIYIGIDNGTSGTIGIVGIQYPHFLCILLSRRRTSATGYFPRFAEFKHPDRDGLLIAEYARRQNL